MPCPRFLPEMPASSSRHGPAARDPARSGATRAKNLRRNANADTRRPVALCAPAVQTLDRPLRVAHAFKQIVSASPTEPPASLRAQRSNPASLALRLPALDCFAALAMTGNKRGPFRWASSTNLLNLWTRGASAAAGRAGSSLQPRGFTGSPKASIRAMTMGRSAATNGRITTGHPERRKGSAGTNDAAMLLAASNAIIATLLNRLRQCR